MLQMEQPLSCYMVGAPLPHSPSIVVVSVPVVQFQSTVRPIGPTALATASIQEQGVSLMAKDLRKVHFVVSTHWGP